MNRPCPSCPDGNEWSINGPTGSACRTCGGKAYVGEDDGDVTPYLDAAMAIVETHAKKGTE